MNSAGIKKKWFNRLNDEQHQYYIRKQFIFQYAEMNDTALFGVEVKYAAVI